MCNIIISDEGRIDDKHIYSLIVNVFEIQEMINDNKGEEVLEKIKNEIDSFFRKKIISPVD